jgi:uncharacterized protein
VPPLFEFDQAKSAANKKKHGIDFVEAQQLWEDDNLVLVQVQFTTEERWLAVAEFENRIWTAVITYRDNAVRIISVGRARDYEEQNHHHGRRT